MDYVTEVNGHAELHPPGFLDPSVAFFHRALDGEGTFNCAHNACELSEDTIAGCVDDAPAVLGNHWQDDRLVRFQIAHRRFFIGAHQRTVPGDVGGEDRCQPAGDL